MTHFDDTAGNRYTHRVYYELINISMEFNIVVEHAPSQIDTTAPMGVKRCTFLRVRVCVFVLRLESLKGILIATINSKYASKHSNIDEMINIVCIAME